VPFTSLSEQVQLEVRNTIDKVLVKAVYDAAEVPSWVDTIATGVLERLQAINDNFKYIVSVIILQRTSAGFHLFSICYWDQQSDGAVTVRWENKTLNCVVSVYAVAMGQS